VTPGRAIWACCGGSLGDDVSKGAHPDPAPQSHRPEGGGDGRRATIKEGFEHLDRQFPGFREALYEEAGMLRRYIKVYLNDQDIRYVGGEAAPVAPGNVVSIVPAIAGGVRA